MPLSGERQRAAQLIAGYLSRCEISIPVVQMPQLDQQVIQVTISDPEVWAIAESLVSALENSGLLAIKVCPACNGTGRPAIINRSDCLVCGGAGEISSQSG